MLGDILIPFVLAPFYKGYSHTSMTISALGNPGSPVRTVFNLWMLAEGILFLLSLPAIYDHYRNVSEALTVIVIVFVVLFAVGACIITCFFSVNETKDKVTTASKIHGIGSVTGFMVFLSVPLLISVLEFGSGDPVLGVTAAVSFAVSLAFFVLFVMSDKPKFADTIIASEGLWQRLNILFMYLPLIVVSAKCISGT